MSVLLEEEGRKGRWKTENGNVKKTKAGWCSITYHPVEGPTKGKKGANQGYSSKRTYGHIGREELERRSHTYVQTEGGVESRRNSWAAATIPLL